MTTLKGGKPDPWDPINGTDNSLGFIFFHISQIWRQSQQTRNTNEHRKNKDPTKVSFSLDKGLGKGLPR